MVERWPVRASDGHAFEISVEGPKHPHAALFFFPAMGVDASYYAPCLVDCSSTPDCRTEYLCEPVTEAGTNQTSTVLICIGPAS